MFDRVYHSNAFTDPASAWYGPGVSYSLIAVTRRAVFWSLPLPRDLGVVVGEALEALGLKFCDHTNLHVPARRESYGVWPFGYKRDHLLRLFNVRIVLGVYSLIKCRTI